jgi:hypothetical protein
MKEDRPYPVRPLIEAYGSRTKLSLGTTWARDLYRLEGAGVMTEQQADKWAVRLGMTPWEVWPELYEALAFPIRYALVAQDLAAARKSLNHLSATLARVHRRLDERPASNPPGTNRSGGSDTRNLTALRPPADHEASSHNPSEVG